MNTQQDSAFVHSLKDKNVHPIPAGTQPGTADATVGPLPGPDGYYMAVPNNLLERTSEQKLADFNREYERAIAFYYAACDAHDAAAGDEANERAEAVVKHAERILRDIERSAYVVPTRTVREVALKARILSYAKGMFWDNTEGEQDADVRFVIEDILTLGGLDRMRRRDFAFRDLLQGYAGQELHDRVHETAQPAKAIPHTQIHTLGLEVESLWAAYTGNDEGKIRDKTRPATFERNMNALMERASDIERQVSYMKPQALPDVMFMVALIHDAADSATTEHRRETRAISRMTAAILEYLSKVTGLALCETGAGAYASSLIAMEAQPAAQRYAADRVDPLRSSADRERAA